mmetsp:Transcript_159781/g.387977  ORF Transcript_159781/g.387977 Transcript_159781/m.387977 type:complete len:311 (+) Transcript_159781:351-1283(+)
MYLKVGGKCTGPSQRPRALGSRPRSSSSSSRRACEGLAALHRSFAFISGRELRSPKTTVKSWDVGFCSSGDQKLPQVGVLWNALDMILWRCRSRLAALALPVPAGKCTFMKQAETLPTAKRARTPPLLATMPPKPVLIRSQQTCLTKEASSLRTYTSMPSPARPKLQTFTNSPALPETVLSTRCSSAANLWGSLCSKLRTLEGFSSMSSCTPTTMMSVARLILNHRVVSSASTISQPFRFHEHTRICKGRMQQRGTGVATGKGLKSSTETSSQSLPTPSLPSKEQMLEASPKSLTVLPVLVSRVKSARVS